jgi:hypothetical protein
MEGNLALVLLVGLGPVPTYAEAELSQAIHAHELRAHVYRLAAPEFQGRQGPGAARAARHVAAAFERLKLRPAFGDSYFQDVPAPTDPTSFIGRNVAAVLPGSDPKLKDEWLILAAHHDHVGVKDGVLHPGADDNASGVAALLEIAEALALSPDRPRRTIVFVSFDQEETGLIGSNHFAKHPPLPLERLRAVLVSDLLGRSMGGVMDEYVFVLGSESSPALRKAVIEVKPEDGLKVGRVGADVIGTRSDYGPFRDRQVPFLFFSTGQHRDYHKPTDTPDRIDYAKLRRIACWERDLLLRLADADEAPAWAEQQPPPDLDEAQTMLVLVRRVLARVELYPLTPQQRELLDGVEGKLAGIVSRGKMTVQERAWLLTTARLLLTALF